MGCLVNSIKKALAIFRPKIRPRVFNNQNLRSFILAGNLKIANKRAEFCRPTKIKELERY